MTTLLPPGFGNPSRPPGSQVPISPDFSGSSELVVRINCPPSQSHPQIVKFVDNDTKVFVVWQQRISDRDRAELYDAVTGAFIWGYDLEQNGCTGHRVEVSTDGSRWALTFFHNGIRNFVSEFTVAGQVYYQATHTSDTGGYLSGSETAGGIFGLSGDGTRMVAYDQFLTGDLLLCDSGDGEPDTRVDIGEVAFNNTFNDIDSCALSSDGAVIAIAGVGVDNGAGGVGIYNTADGSERLDPATEARYTPGIYGGLNALSISSDGAVVTFGNATEIVVLKWGGASYTRTSIPVPAGVVATHVSEDGDHALAFVGFPRTWGGYGTCSVYELDTSGTPAVAAAPSFPFNQSSPASLLYHSPKAARFNATETKYGLLFGMGTYDTPQLHVVKSGESVSLPLRQYPENPLNGYGSRFCTTGHFNAAVTRAAIGIGSSRNPGNSPPSNSWVDIVTVPDLA